MKRLALYALLVSPGIVPLVAPYLPFQDWGLHLGIIGAYVHLRPGSPLAQWIEPAHSLNALFGQVAALLAVVLPPLWAANGTLAVALGGLGPATARLCRVAGVDERAALLCLPLALGRHVYCGFAPNAAALVPFVLTLAELVELSKTTETRIAARHAIAMAGLLVLTGLLHGFVFLATCGLASLWLLTELFRRRVAACFVGLVAIVVSAIVVLPTMRVPGVSTDMNAALAALVAAAETEDRSRRAIDLFEWLFASYRYSRVDDVLQALWLWAVVGLLALGASRSRRLTMVGAVSLATFVLLPTNIGPPVNWWGAGLRLPVMAFLAFVPVAGAAFSERRSLAIAIRSLMGLGVVVAVVAISLATVDLVRFVHTEMLGFREVLDAIPPKQRLAALHFTPREVNEYPGEPHGYVSSYYLLISGGYPSENAFGEGSHAPFRKKVDPATSPWGYGSGFRFGVHGRFFDGFLVRTSPNRPEAPFEGLVGKKVRLLKAAGNWRYYEKLEEP